MSNHRRTLVSVLTLTAIAGASCDIAPVTPEVSADTEIPLIAPRNASSPAAAQPGEAVHSFQIEIALVDPAAEEIRARIVSAAERWTKLVRHTDLADIQWSPGPIRCGGLVYDYRKDVIDDLFVMVSVRDIDGAGGTVLQVTTCGYRNSSSQPLIGTIVLDRADFNRMERGDGYDVILHGFGHMLGFGLSPRWKDLLRLPSKQNEGADTHFAGARAIGAFDLAGGADYAGAKVPVQDRPGEGSRDKHWRERVLDWELMTPSLRAGRPDPLSAITAQSLADMGYTVDLEHAEAYMLPGAAHHAAVRDGERWPSIDLSGDVLTVPAAFYDGHGRVVRVVRPN